MQPTPPLLKLLQLMENMYIVAAMVAVMIIVRWMYAHYLKRIGVPVFKEVPVAGPAKATTGGSKKNQAKNKNSTQPVKLHKNFTLEIIDTLLIALILVFGIIRPLVLQTFFIPSESMLPLLQIKDKLIANKYIYHFRTPRRGEVIVFKPPIDAVIYNNPQLMQRAWLEKSSLAEISALDPKLADNREKLLAALPPNPTQIDDYIKRVIGVAGDKIRVNNYNELYVNGKLQIEPYVNPDKNMKSKQVFPDAMAKPTSPLTIYDPKIQNELPALRDQLRENTGQEFDDDAAYFALLTMGWLQQWHLYNNMYLKNISPNIHNGEFIVPPGSVFVMGDNRGNSLDSRYWGVVPLANVKARAVSTFWPILSNWKFNLKLL